MLNIVARRCKDHNDVIITLYSSLPKLIQVGFKDEKAEQAVSNILNLKFPENSVEKLEEILGELWKLYGKGQGKQSQIARRAISSCIKTLSTCQKVF